MKIKFIIPALVLSLISCHDVKEEDNIPTSKVEILTSLEETEDTAKKETETPAKKEEESASTGARTIAPSALLIARGSEPGWYAEFYKDHALLVFDYGKDTVKIDHDFSNVGTDKIYTSKIMNVTNEGKKTSLDLLVKVGSKSCIADNGDKKDKTILIKYNGKEYKGCAEVK